MKSSLLCLFTLLALSQTAIAQDAPKAAAPAAGSSGGSGWQFALGGGLTLGGSGNFANADVKNSGSSTYSGDARITYKPSLSLTAEVRYLREHKWGFTGGLDYEFKKKSSSYSLTSFGTTTTGDNVLDGSSIQFTTIYAGTAYRWGMFYLPFGFNYSIVKFYAGDSFAGTTTAKGAGGTQVGAGWMINEHFALETYLWITSMSLDATAASSSVDFGSGYFASIKGFAKYVF